MFQIREKSDKKGDKMGDFFYSTLSYDRDKKNERIPESKKESLRTLIFCTRMLCSRLVTAFLLARMGDAPFPYQV